MQKEIQQPRSLAEWRERQRLNQRDAAKIFRISQTAYSRLERKILIPRRNVLARVKRKTGLTVDQLLGMAS